MGATPPPSPLPSPLPAGLTAASPRAAASGVTIALMIVIWLAWLGVTVIADFLGFMMFAFADSPGAGRAAQAMILPAFIWFGFTFVAGAVLLIVRRWWTIVLAFALAVSPPFLIFAGYNVLAGAGVGSPSAPAAANPAAGTPTAPPPVSARVPPGGFKPAPTTSLREQPDFQAAIRELTAATSRPTTAP